MKILFVGDIMCHDEQLAAAHHGGDDYGFDVCFSNIKNRFSKYDHVVGNLETVITDGPWNGFPKFSTPPQFISALNNAGIDVLLLANNHCCDRGKSGVESTLGCLKKYNMLTTGVGVTESSPLILQDTAILNYTAKLNVECSGVIVNRLDDITKISADIDTAKMQGVSNIIVVVHWGDEYEKLYNQTQFEIANILINLGANLVIGSHPHTVQEYTTISGVPVVYSLGNFISSQVKKDTTRGIGVEVDTDTMETNVIEFETKLKNGTYVVEYK